MRSQGGHMRYESLQGRFFSEASCERWIRKKFSEQLTFTEGVYFCGTECRISETGFVFCEQKGRVISP